MTAVTTTSVVGGGGENEKGGGVTSDSTPEEKVATTTVGIQQEGQNPKQADVDIVLQLLRSACSSSSSSNNNNNSLLSCHPSFLLDLKNVPSSFYQMKSLNLSNTGLSSLPENFAHVFPQLSILFLSNNHFVQVPAVIGQCQHLQMVAFKSNNSSLSSIHPDALQSQLRWLILTDNQITVLPTSIGRCTKLQKLMLSGNCLVSLPDEISNCKALELVRLASNRLQDAPMQLLQLPNLAWVGLSDNPFLLSSHASSVSQQQQQPVPLAVVLHDLDETQLESAKVLGRGAGGITYQLRYRNQWVAVKQFASEMTSDGLPSQERSISYQASALLAAGQHKNCSSAAFIRVLGETTPSGCMVMEYLQNFVAMAGPPSMESCSRDVYEERDENNNKCWTLTQAVQVLALLLCALVELHKIGICHGDFYGHNILIRHENDNTDDNDNNEYDNNNNMIQARLTDFGAAFKYDPTTTSSSSSSSSHYGKLLARIELRAYSHLVQEVQDNLVVVKQQEDDNDNNNTVLMDLVAQCRKDGATLDSVYVWLKQEQLKANGVCL
jgi:hypothetical protein